MVDINNSDDDEVTIVKTIDPLVKTVEQPGMGDKIDSPSSSPHLFEHQFSPATCFSDEEIISGENILRSGHQRGDNQTRIPRETWDHVVIQECENVPHNVDDLTIYHVKASDKQALSQKLRDGRNWGKDSRTTWSDYKTVRYRSCSGGRTCPNDQCPYLVEFKKTNEVDFDKNGYCKFCQATGIFEKCFSRKYVAYSNNPNEAYVYHYGKHTCSAKQIHQPPIFQMAKAVESNPSVRPTEIQTNGIVSALRNRTLWGSIRQTAKQFSDTRKISNEKQKQRKKIYPSGEDFHGVSDFKEYTDNEDKYLIYDVNRDNDSLLMIALGICIYF
ncbi:uncharacterized protein [Clytia hemisphaerica]|uniref:uncharacterized protein n=1 Tax=Clytia hemisphaerica TaxID=252671 RepID=UPI0034D5F3BC